MIPEFIAPMTNQQLAALSIDRQRWLAVQAGAGAGKTAVLSARFVLILESGVPVEEIVAITFTRKAAREMQGRVQKYLEQRILELAESGENAEALSILLTARERFHLNRISTIDSFCRSLLASHSLEANVDPSFGMLDENNEERLRVRFLREASRKLTSFVNTEGNTELQALTQAFAKLHDWLGNRDVSGIMTVVINDDGSLSDALAAWGNFTDASVRSEYKNIARRMSETLRESAIETLELVSRINEAIEGCERLIASGNTPEKATEFLRAMDLWLSGKKEWQEVQFARAKPGSGKAWAAAGIDPKSLTQIRNDLLDVESCAPFDEELEETNIDLLHALATLAPWLRREWRETKRDALAFNDLKLEALRFLQHESASRSVALGISYLMIDEFQDTDPVQWELFERIVAQGHTNLFVVGDTKQSIYRFRGADVSVFEEAARRIVDHNTKAGTNTPPAHPITGEAISHQIGDVPTLLDAASATGVIRLTANFRSTSATLECGNLVFHHVFGLHARDAEPARELDSFDARADDMTLIRSDDPKLAPRVEILPFVRSSNRTEETSDSGSGSSEDVSYTLGKDENLCHLIAQRLLKLREEHQLSWSQVAILTRTNANIATLRSVLPRYGIPYQVSGGKQLLTTLEAREFLLLVAALADPREDFAMLGLMRSSFLGVSDEVLTMLSGSTRAGERKRRVPFITLLREEDHWPEELTREEADHLRWCKRWFDGIAWRVGEESMHGLLREALISSGAWAHSIESSREQRAANLHRLLALAESYELELGPDMLGFSDDLRLRVEASERVEEGSVAGSTDAVQVMTIHASKGKEFDIVALPFLGKSRSDFDRLRFGRHIDPSIGRPAIAIKPLAWFTREENAPQASAPVFWEHLKQQEALRSLAEDRRLFYVAWTRARHQLLLCPILGAKDKDEPVVPDPEKHYAGLGDFLLQGLNIPNTQGCYLSSREDILKALPQQLASSIVLADPDEGITTPLEASQPIIDRAEAIIAHSSSKVLPEGWTEERLQLAAPVEAKRRLWRFTASKLGVSAFAKEEFASLPLSNVVPMSGQPPLGEGEETEFGTLVHQAIEAQLRGRVLDLPSMGYSVEEISWTQRHADNAVVALHRDGKPMTELIEYAITIAVDDALADTAIDYVSKVSEGHWRIIDFKTGEDHQHYRAQLAVYALGLKRRLELAGEKVDRIDTALLFTSEARIFEIASFSGADFDRLEASLRTHILQQAG